jgi:hypothetical protein
MMKIDEVHKMLPNPAPWDFRSSNSHHMLRELLLYHENFPWHI